MTGVTLGLFIDVSVLIFLSVAIYLAVRLSKSLENFRTAREDFKDLISELTANIDHAQEAVEKLKQAGNDTAVKLEGLIADSKGLIKELQIMNETGDELASRLEIAAARNARNAPLSVAQSAPFPDKPAGKPVNMDKPSSAWEEPETAQDESEEDAPPSFFIQDRDIETGWGDDMDDDISGFEGGAEDDVPADLQSQAERELYRALKRNKKQNAA